MFKELGLTPESRRELRKGETLFNIEEEVVSFFSLETGKIRMSRNMTDGNRVTFYVVNAGQLFAEASLFSKNYHCEAVAEEPSIVAIYSKAKFLNAMRENQSGAFMFMEHLAKQVQKQRAHIELMHIKSAPDRLLAYIHNKMRARDVELHLETTWKTVADEINLTHEAVYRALSVLERTGAISRDGRQITLISD